MARPSAGLLTTVACTRSAHCSTVCRPARVRIKALDRNGAPFELTPEGLLAVCVQHEVDHLRGKLYVDYISSLKRTRIRKKLEKQQRHSA